MESVIPLSVTFQLFCVVWQDAHVHVPELLDEEEIDDPACEEEDLLLDELEELAGRLEEELDEEEEDDDDEEEDDDDDDDDLLGILDEGLLNLHVGLGEGVSREDNELLDSLELLPELIGMLFPALKASTESAGQFVFARTDPAMDDTPST